jgi:hypothetical protein
MPVRTELAVQYNNNNNNNNNNNKPNNNTKTAVLGTSHIIREVLQSET